MNIDFEKSGGLVPAIVQDALTMQVLMLGYMNKEALEKNLAEGKVTFFGRSKTTIVDQGWRIGTFSYSGWNPDRLRQWCHPRKNLSSRAGHKGTYSCFGKKLPKGFLYELENLIEQRIADNPENSYTSNLFNRGVNKVAQKVGEEAVELVIEAKDDHIDLFKTEAADLHYHFLILC